MLLVLLRALNLSCVDLSIYIAALNLTMCVTTNCYIRMWQSQVENEDHSVFNWLNSINSNTVMLGQLKPNVGTPLADRLGSLETKFELSKSFFSRTTLM